MYAFLGDCTIFLESEKFTTEKEGHCLRFFALQSVSLDALGKALDNMSESFQTKWQRFANYCKMKQKELLTSEFCKLVIRSLIFFSTIAMKYLFIQIDALLQIFCYYIVPVHKRYMYIAFIWENQCV